MYVIIIAHHPSQVDRKRIRSNAYAMHVSLAFGNVTNKSFAPMEMIRERGQEEKRVHESIQKGEKKHERNEAGGGRHKRHHNQLRYNAQNRSGKSTHTKNAEKR